MIWDSVLSQEEINLANNPQLESEVSLMGYWKFNAGEGEILFDHSGSANHGFVYGASWDTDVPAPEIQYYLRIRRHCI